MHEEYVGSEMGECITQCKEGTWRDLSQEPFVCRMCTSSDELLQNSNSDFEYTVLPCSAFSDTALIRCGSEEAGWETNTCDLPGSDKVRDACGVCGGTNQSCTDCLGQLYGKASFDACGECNGTNACWQVDCAGVLNGPHVNDSCGVCGGDNTSCVDRCGVRDGQNECEQPVLDACGEPGGDNSSCWDCQRELGEHMMSCHTCISTGQSMHSFQSNSCECNNSLCDLPTRSNLIQECPYFTKCSLEEVCSSVDQCSPCQANQVYNDLEHYEHCQTCGDGEHVIARIFAGFFEYTWCKDCPAGTYAKAGSVVCEPCAELMYSRVAAPECACNSGHEDVGEDTCRECLPGWFSEFNDYKLDTECMQCEVGKYSPNAGLAACEECPSGLTTVNVGSTKLNDCTCSAGYEYLNGVCTACLPGWYKADLGLGKCTACAEGKFGSAAGSISETHCNDCHAGTYLKKPERMSGTALDFDSVCAHCPIATYFPGVGDGIDSCIACNAGYSTVLNASVTGSTQINYADACTGCPPGTYKGDDGVHEDHERLDADSGCLICPPDTYNVGDAMTACLRCPTNTATTCHLTGGCTKDDHDDVQHCHCAAGYYGELPETCHQCETGKFKADIGFATECTWCVAGKQTTSKGQDECEECPATTYSQPLPLPDGTSGQCNVCPPNADSDAGSGVCKCNVGYGNFPGDATDTHTCERCSPGKYSELAEAVPCRDCAAGTYSNWPLIQNAGWSGCVDSNQCPECKGDCDSDSHCQGDLICHQRSASDSGTTNPPPTCDPSGMITDMDYCYNPHGVLSSCSACAAGKYAFLGASVCSDCPAGEEPNPGATDCQNCEAGKYSASAGTTCSDCPAGQYSYSNALVCEDCPAGEEPNSGASDCQKCAKGTYSAISGDACTECAAGSYNPILEIQCSSGCFFTYSTYYTAILCPAMSNTNTHTGSHIVPFVYYTGHFTTYYPVWESYDCTMTMKSTGSITVQTSDIENLQYSVDETGLIDTSSPITSNTGLLTLRMRKLSNRATARDPVFNWEVTGATACTSCPAGTTAPAGSTAASNCADCAAGKYAASAGSSECTECAGGSYNPILQIECSPGCSYDAWYDGLKTLTLCNPIQSSNVFAGSQSYSWNPSCSGCIVGDYDCMITMKSTGTIKVDMTNHEAPLEYSTVNESSFISHGTFSWGGTDTATIVSNTGVLIMNPKIRQGKTSARYGFNWNWEITGATTCLQCPAGTTSPAGSDSESDCV